MTQLDRLGYLKSTPDVSVLIVGGGVNGVGVFRDLALQGVDVVLIDKADFCSGASAASSHMLHGGIRYLENGEFRLVREALQERNLLLKNAPHQARPLPTVIPIFKWLSGMFNAPLKFIRLLDKPDERGLIVIKIGLMLYDALAARGNVMPGHSIRTRRDSLRDFPDLDPSILATARYCDGAILSPERLCIEMILDAEFASPQARAFNYVTLVEARGGDVALQDNISTETITIRPRILINAAGPWIDLANRAIGRSTRFIDGTKGSHLVLDHPELRAAIGEYEFFFENADGRIVLIFPLADKVLIGTTDIRVSNPEGAHCTEEEMDYLLGMIPRLFPQIKAERAHIVFRFAGVRPLPIGGASNTDQISRDHVMQVTEPDRHTPFPIYNLIGGKWTTFRAFAEQVTNSVLNRLGRPRIVSTAQLAMGGGKDYPGSQAERDKWIASAAETTGVKKERIRELFERYGTRAKEVTAFITKGVDHPLKSFSGYTNREIMYLAQTEKITHLDDFFLRRTMLAMLGNLNLAGVDEVCDIIGDALGLERGERRAEVTRFFGILAERHGVRLER